MTAIKAAFADWRPVKSRGVLQLVLEVPVEQTKLVLDTLGAPIPGTEKWVGVALLNPPGAGTEATHGSVASPAPPPPEKPANAPGGAYAKRAGILCNNPRFQAWIGGGGIDDARPAEDAADLLRWQTDVASRRDYDSDPAARRRFLDLETRYLRETGQFAEERR